MQLTEHFKLSEFTDSQTARAHGIRNVPNAAQVDNLRLLCVNVLQPLRDALSMPIDISSGYRCPALNRRIGGARNSQHQRGMAADFKVAGVGIDEAFAFIVNSDLPYDQVIYEFGQWIHISFDATRAPRRMALVATRDKDGKVKYTPYKQEKNEEI